MSITFDYVTMAPKSQEVSQIHVHELNRLQQENQQIASQFESQVKKSSEQTVRRNKAENKELRDEEKRRQQRRKKQSDSNHNGDDEGEEKVPHFDMRI